MRLCDMVRIECESRGWSRNELGRVAGMTGRFLMDIEADKRGMSVGRAVDLARGLDQRPGRWIEAVFNRQLEEAGLPGRMVYVEDK